MPLDMVELSVELLERGVHARVLGMAKDDCARLVRSVARQEGLSAISEDLCCFGWAIEDAFQAAGLDSCILAPGNLLLVRPDTIA